MKAHLKSWDTAWLLRTKSDLEFEASNWLRRIKEIESGVIDANGYPPVSEYRGRIAKIEQKIADIDEELESRGELTVTTNDNNSDGGDKAE